MPKRLNRETHQKYTKVFSNILNPFMEVEFQNDSRNPVEEMRSAPKPSATKHIIQDFGIGLFDIKEFKFQMRQFTV